MICERCGNTMSGGAPHCETIKIQMECHNCGNIECEYYTPEEQKVNELTVATGASLRDCWKALTKADFNLTLAENYLKQNNF